jgi:phosphatidylglycerophosphate synthase
MSEGGVQAADDGENQKMKAESGNPHRPAPAHASDSDASAAAPAAPQPLVDGSAAPAAPQPRRPTRPRELQDALNYHLYHPLAWQLARVLARTALTPNVVSVIGGCFVVAAGIAYSQPGWPLSALIGMVLHMTWHVVDGADGDLARMTGRTSPIGEMVDGLCDYISHIILYLTLGWLLAHGMEPAIWPVSHPALWMWAAGISHILQANHVEVQRRQYQWWVYGTSWIRMNHGADSATRKSVFGGIVSAYLAVASGMTPHALKIDAAVEAARGDPARMEAIRAAVRAEAPPLLRLCKILGPNPRAIVLGLSMLAGSPLWYFLYQSLALNALLVISVVAHNRAAQRIAARIGA